MLYIVTDFQVLELNGSPDMLTMKTVLKVKLVQNLHCHYVLYCLVQV